VGGRGQGQGELAGSAPAGDLGDVATGQAAIGQAGVERGDAGGEDEAALLVQASSYEPRMRM
jgi:hypothetical protein